MNREDQSRADAAALSYLCIRLRGRASRLRRRAQTRARREPLTLNEPPLGERTADKLDAVADPGWERNYVQIGDRMALYRAMESLTRREAALVFELFWSQKTVTEICHEMRVSKNSVLKMKRNAFRKLRKSLTRMNPDAMESEQSEG